MTSWGISKSGGPLCSIKFATSIVWLFHHFNVELERGRTRDAVACISGYISCCIPQGKSGSWTKRAWRVVDTESVCLVFKVTIILYLTCPESKEASVKESPFDPRACLWRGRYWPGFQSCISEFVDLISNKLWNHNWCAWLIYQWLCEIVCLDVSCIFVFSHWVASV